jgi:hypothetical protein
VNDEIKIPAYPTMTFDSLPPVFWLDLAIERLEALSRVDRVQAQKLGTALVLRLREAVERLC